MSDLVPAELSMSVRYPLYIPAHHSVVGTPGWDTYSMRAW